MSNEKFPYFTRFTLGIVLIFILSPLLLLLARGLPHLKRCIQSEEIMYSIKLSLKTSTISTIICLILALPVAYGLVRSNIRFKKVISTIIFLPMSLPHMISGVALLLFLGNMGIGGFLSKFNLDFVFTKKGIVAAQVFVNLPFMIHLIKIAIEELGYRMEFIARTLGCSQFQTFIYITIPLIKNSLLSSLIVTWSRALGEFGAVMMLAGATSMKTEVMSTAIFMNMSTGDLDLAIAVASILVMISIISILLVELVKSLGLNNERGKSC